MVVAGPVAAADIGAVGGDGEEHSGRGHGEELRSAGRHPGSRNSAGRVYEISEKMKLVALFLALLGLTTGLRVVRFRRLEPTVPPQSCMRNFRLHKIAQGPPRRVMR